MLRFGVTRSQSRHRLWARTAKFINRLFRPGAVLRVHTWPSELIAHTKEVWGRRLGREITDQEAITTINSFGNLVKLLKEIHREQHRNIL